MATYAPETYTAAEAAVNELVAQARDIARIDGDLRGRFEQLERQLEDVSKNTPVGWAEAFAYIDAQEDLNKNDVAFRGLKARKDKAVADIAALQDRMNEINSFMSQRGKPNPR